MKTYYGQEVNKLRVPVDKDLFPNLLARARAKAFTSHNVKEGFRATGIYPYNPQVILQKVTLPEPDMSPENPAPPLELSLQTPQDLISYRPTTLTTPQAIHNLYVEGLATINSTSPRSIKQRAIFTKLKRSAERNAASVVMHEAGEEYLREEIKQIMSRGKADRRQLNSRAACVLERGDTLAEMKHLRDEKDAEKENRKRQKKSQPVLHIQPILEDRGLTYTQDASLNTPTPGQSSLTNTLGKNTRYQCRPIQKAASDLELELNFKPTINVSITFQPSALVNLRNRNTYNRY